MKTINLRFAAVFLLLIPVFLFGQTTYSWNSTGGRTGNWDDSINWTPTGVPGPGDEVVNINVNDTVYTNGPRQIAGFESNGVIIISGDNGGLTVTGNSTWTGGRIVGRTNGGGTLTISPGAMLEVVNGMVWGALLEEGATLHNQGIILAHSGFSVIENSTVVNDGVFEIDGDIYFGTSAANTGFFVNSGIIRKSAGTSIAQFTAEWQWSNLGGQFDVQTGTLRLSGGGTFLDGFYNADSGATLRFAAGDTCFFEGTLSGSPAGNVELGGTGPVHVGPSGATLDFLGAGIQWAGRDFIGGGTVTIAAGGLMVTIPGSASLIDGATTLLNLGTIRAESNFLAINGSTVDNRGLLDITGDYNFGTSGIFSGTFLNSGTVRKSGGSIISSFASGWNWQNLAGGIIDAISGTLKIDNLENNDGSIIQGSATAYLPGSFIDHGIVRPGNSAGVLNYRLDYAPSTTGVLDIELGGLTPGSEHDQLIVDRTVSLNGTLNLSLINGFVPAAGDSFEILTSLTGAVNDSFLTVNIPSGLFVDIVLESSRVVIVIDSVGTVAIDDRDEPGTTAIRDWFLEQNYPNPFNPTTNVEFGLPKAEWVNLIIYDMLGRRVRTLVDENRASGRHVIQWDGRDQGGRRVASGAYLYRLEAGGRSLVRKMLLLK